MPKKTKNKPPEHVHTIASDVLELLEGLTEAQEASEDEGDYPRCLEVITICPCSAYDIVWARDGRPVAQAFHFVALINDPEGDQRIVPCLPNSNAPGEFGMLFRPCISQFIRLKPRDEAFRDEDWLLARLLYEEPSDSGE